MSPVQKELISGLKKDETLFVEGGFRIWLQDVQVTYFILRGSPVKQHSPPTGDVDQVTDMKMWMYGKSDPGTSVEKALSVHEQSDGTILGVCATGTSSKDSLLSWVRFLQRDNPDLENIPILFTLSSPLGPVIPISEASQVSSKK